MTGAAWRNLLITVALAGLAAYAGARLGQVPLPRTGPPVERTGLRDNIFQVVHRDMTLTPEQKRQIEEIDARHSHSRILLRAQINTADAELGEALANEMALGTAASRALDRLQDLMGQLQRETVLYVLDVRAVLTPAQQQLLDRRIFESLAARPF
jgi:hypothetical protein